MRRRHSDCSAAQVPGGGAECMGRGLCLSHPLRTDIFCALALFTLRRTSQETEGGERERIKQDGREGGGTLLCRNRNTQPLCNTLAFGVYSTQRGKGLPCRQRRRPLTQFLPMSPQRRWDGTCRPWRCVGGRDGGCGGGGFTSAASRGSELSTALLFPNPPLPDRESS